MSVTKILVCCHKPGKFISDDAYLPIHVGKANSKYNLGIIGDDTGDNISSENSHFCELTGLYWAWKNLHPVDYIGLCHYRRYFNFHDKGTAFSDCTIVSSKDIEHLDIKLPNMDELFIKYDAIVAKPKVYPYSLSVDYCVCQVSEDFHTLSSIVKGLYPEYGEAFDEVFFKNNKLSHYNMMVMRWSDFDRYCTWLFDILFEARNKINIDNYSPVQGRIWGYMSERLLSVWLLHNHKKIKLQPVYWITDDVEQHSFLNRWQRYIRNSLAFMLTKPRKTTNFN